MFFFDVIVLDSQGKDVLDCDVCRKVRTDKTIASEKLDVDFAVQALEENNLLGLLSNEDRLTFKWDNTNDVLTVYINCRPKFQFQKVVDKVSARPETPTNQASKIVSWCFSKINNSIGIANTNMIIASLNGSSSPPCYISYLLGQLRESQKVERCKRIVDVLHLFHLYRQDENQDLYEGMIKLYLIVLNEED